MSKTLLLTQCLCAALALSAAAGDRPGRFDAADVTKPGFFPILPWDPYHGWGQPLIDRGKLGLQNIADCNFNLAGFVLPQDLPACKKLGLGAILLTSDPAFTNVQYIYGWKKLSDAEIDQRVKRMIDSGGRNASIVGYFITDEPGVTDFPALGKAVAAVKKYAPGKLAYINLFPNCATLGAPDISQLGATTYHEYLEKFVEEVHPQLLSYDNYMVQYSMDMRDRGQGASYYNNLLEVRRVGLEHHLPYLNIAASCQLRKDKAIPTPANLLLQTYTTLAAGYRGITWYTYFADGYEYAPIAADGKKTPVWSILQDVNHQAAVLAPILSRLTSTGVYFTSPAPADGLPTLPGKLVQSVSCSTPIMVGEFSGNDDERYAMIVNLSLDQSAPFTLRTASSAANLKIISSVDSLMQPFNPSKQYWLMPGQGVLLQSGR